MAKILGEAVIDNKTQKFYFQIKTDDGEVLDQSTPIFNSQFEAETELVKLLTELSSKIGT